MVEHNGCVHPTVFCIVTHPLDFFVLPSPGVICAASSLLT
jgi:hypothetical protein